jgi:hypothetical protein
MSETEAVTGMGAVWKLVVTAFFVALNGFFVAAEFALVKVRVSRLDALAQAGSRAARATMTILSDLSLYLSACQLGITISSLVLGWLAERTSSTWCACRRGTSCCPGWMSFPCPPPRARTRTWRSSGPLAIPAFPWAIRTSIPPSAWSTAGT